MCVRVFKIKQENNGIHQCLKGKAILQFCFYKNIAARN